MFTKQIYWININFESCAGRLLGKGRMIINLRHICLEIKNILLRFKSLIIVGGFLVCYFWLKKQFLAWGWMKITYLNKFLNIRYCTKTSALYGSKHLDSDHVTLFVSLESRLIVAMMSLTLCMTAERIVIGNSLCKTWIPVGCS